MTKRENRPRFLVRLNLNNPRHRDAWERLQHRGNVSYSEAVVSAINQQSEGKLPDSLRSELTQAMYDVAKEALSNCQPSKPMVNAPAPTSSMLSMDDADFDAAMDFMNNLG